MTEEEQKHLQQSYYDLHEKYNKQKVEIERLNKDNGDIIKLFAKEREETKRLHSIIKEVREYINSHCLYEEEYDYDYEENSYLSGISDEVAKQELLEILDKAEENK